jgi:hypothetical protein
MPTDRAPKFMEPLESRRLCSGTTDPTGGDTGPSRGPDGGVPAADAVLRVLRSLDADSPAAPALKQVLARFSSFFHS